MVYGRIPKPRPLEKKIGDRLEVVSGAASMTEDGLTKDDLFYSSGSYFTEAELAQGKHRRQNIEEDSLVVDMWMELRERIDKMESDIAHLQNLVGRKPTKRKKNYTTNKKK